MFIVQECSKYDKENYLSLSALNQIFDNLKKHAIPLEEFLESLFVSAPIRVAGTAVFLRGEADGVPHALLHNLSHNKISKNNHKYITNVFDDNLLLSRIKLKFDNFYFEKEKKLFSLNSFDNDTSDIVDNNE